MLRSEQVVERLTEELRGMIHRLAAMELATSQVTS